MREYETTFIVQPEITEEGCAELFGRVDQTLEKEGATRLLHDDQGKRRLAYEIQDFQKGRYVTTYFLDEGSAVAPLERALRLDESVLRFLTVLRTPDVTDIDARKAEAAEEERIRAERARERAEREAEEEKARQESAREAAVESAARAAEAAAAAAQTAADESREEAAAPDSDTPAAEAAAPDSAAPAAEPEADAQGAADDSASEGEEK